MRYASIATVFLCQAAFSYFTYIWLTFTFVEVKDMILLNMQQIKSEIGAFEHVEEIKSETGVSENDITLSSSRTVRLELVRELWSDDDPFKYANTKNVDDAYPHTNNVSLTLRPFCKYKRVCCFGWRWGRCSGGQLFERRVW